MGAPSIRGYYAILDASLAGSADAAVLAELAARAGRLLAAQPCVLQLRAKTAPARALAEAARTLLPLCRAAGVPLCVNDRLDVALAVGADMAHLGQDDLPLAEARRVAAGRIVVGISTHDLAQARAAEAGGADYIGFGPVFATGSKDKPDAVVGLSGLAQVCRAVSLPVVAIGGITVDAAAAVAQAGAAAAAAIAAVERAPDPTAAGRRVAAAFAARC